ncbi:MAG: alginate export family protein [Rickettsiales bacterium]|nr:alginate export family protein [Pseudomonadota bacterium]MDA0967468.1 alginate export family protein [Pseudomonadota bacterium]MDG4544164.1 alginate export family protein [Rickettsiales bacterium]MDG4546345.1 alginate export family protein [Rickettsiales bacterium]MDG4548488.1 alginate export family protein [Rickettsiales bacterium]
MKKLLTYVLLGASALATGTVTAHAGDVKSDSANAKQFASLHEALKASTPYFDARYRYESAKQDTKKDSNASTLRTRLGIKTGEFYKTYAVVEAENISRIGSGEYYDTVNGKSSYTKIVDPDGSEINQAYLNYTPIPDTEIRVGRQAVNLDNERFVSSAEWRQNNQTLDAIGITNNSIKDLTLYYNYTNNVNRVTGEDASNGDWDSNIHMFNAKYSPLKYLIVTAYGYLLDIEDSTADSSQTFGGSVGGKYPINDDLKLLYHAEYAAQSDYGDNTNNYDANYWHVSPGLYWKGLEVKLGYEVLESDRGTAATAFRTPLGNIYELNGLTNKFTDTPAGGLEDSYVKVSYKIKGIHDYVDDTKIELGYHDFDAQKSGVNDYGHEWNAIIKRQFLEHYEVKLKYASFEAETNGGQKDTEKFSVQFGIKF